MCCIKILFQIEYYLRLITNICNDLVRWPAKQSIDKFHLKWFFFLGLNEILVLNDIDDLKLRSTVQLTTITLWLHSTWFKIYWFNFRYSNKKVQLSPDLIKTPSSASPTFSDFENGVTNKDFWYLVWEIRHSWMLLSHYQKS